MGLSIEEIIARFASRQHGVVTRSQLLESGLTERMVEGRVKAKRLRPLHRGVYAAGPMLVPQAREMAAVLACGPPAAAASHTNGAWLWKLLPRPADGTPVHVTFEGPDRGRRRGIRPHRVTRLDPSDVAVVDGIPVTTPGRTLLDLAGLVTARELEQALAQAERQQLNTRGQLGSLLARRPGARGTRVLRALLGAEGGPALTRSRAEELFLELIRSARLPAPEVNVAIAGYEVDFLWRALRLAVEVDGFAYHSSRTRFERDRRRDADLDAEGIQVIRVTWRQIVGDRDATLARVARAMGRAEAR
jgi:very-short-patch-repair endonuclease